MIDFNIPPFTGKELEYMQQAIKNKKICGDGEFTKKCSHWMEEKFQANHVLLTTSCTHALEMAAVLTQVKPGDEVILPSYTFVSTADAFVQRGATLVFVDIRPDTMNLDERLIEDAITDKTKVIVPVHYAGVGCAMDEIMEIVKGPDFPTGAQILGRRGIEEAYRTGKGKIRVRAVTNIESMQNG